ncbi:uncharacterized protein LOC124255913 isoform X2 [Haliotis rubra]|uniref:uncharacterized protein LOC124255913 isoform X2 n=1 Tax=Haliotis rubra TaxID=36100 RepID=UPI001EE52732|nr:uncharacterized protein LOC124255913 isoform X2 [Haliotis rubra]
MTMSSLVLDKVSPIRRQLEMRTSLVVMAFCAGVLSCAGHWASASVIVCLTRYPQFATEGVEFTLSCTSTHSGGLISVRWYRNNVEMFHTSSDADVSTSIFNPATTPSESRAVAGRVTVSSSIQQHNVTLRINSTLDQGSVWKCQAGSRSSNNVTVEITDNTEASISVKATRNPVKDGQILTLICESTSDIKETVWSRNSVNIFKTIIPTSMLVYDTSSPQYQSVAGRVTVNSTLTQHNVSLRINSTLDQGSVWRCHTGDGLSNNVTLDVIEHMRGDAVTTIATINSPSTSEDGSILPLIAAIASISVVIVIVVASFICVLLVRKYKKDVAESNSQMYSTMSRDPDTDNNYSELGPGLTSKRLPASQPVTTDESVAYYNTVPADSQYENPPASTENPDSSYSE